MAEIQSQSFQDMFIRSRKTILEILTLRGYDVTPYSKMGPEELAKLCSAVVLHTNPDALEINVKHRENPEKSCLVKYSYNRVKNDLEKVVKKLLENEEEPEKVINPEFTEVIYIVLEPMADNFHASALKAWYKNKLRIQYYWIPSLVNNPMNHVLQPKFEIVPQEQHKDLMKEKYVTSKSQFPAIRFHVDMMARILGLVPGDIVKITRPSYSSGTYELYRVCTP
jgi:DNA-directed RNA polymerase subunit H (RpoH/RPB5)